MDVRILANSQAMVSGWETARVRCIALYVLQKHGFDGHMKGSTVFGESIHNWAGSTRAEASQISAGPNVDEVELNLHDAIVAFRTSKQDRFFGNW